MAYEELKQRQSVMSGTGPYQRITETLTDIHERVIDGLDPNPATAGSTSRREPGRSPNWRRLGVRP